MPRSLSRRARGAQGEEIAARYLRAKGWSIVARSWRPRFAPRLGEVDLLARDGSTLVVVEVRSRAVRAYGSALESVDAKKAARLVRLARAASRAYDEEDVRIDVIGIETIEGETRLAHLPGAVEAG